MAVAGVIKETSMPSYVLRGPWDPAVTLSGIIIAVGIFIVCLVVHKLKGKYYDKN